MRVFFITIFIIILKISNISALTIHRDDLSDLEIAYDYYHSRNYVNIDQIEPNRWEIVKEHKLNVEYDPYQLPDHIVVWFGFENEDEYVREIDSLLITSAYQPRAIRLNKLVLFIWQKLPGDSLKLVSSTAYDKNCSTFGSIFYVGHFPDNSRFIITQSHYYKHGIMCDDFIVFKEVENYKYKLLYTKNLFRDVVRNKYVEMIPSIDTLSESEFNLILDYKYYEIFLKEDSTTAPVDGTYVSKITHTTDSTKTETIDLWELAKKKYNLEGY